MPSTVISKIGCLKIAWRLRFGRSSRKFCSDALLLKRAVDIYFENCISELSLGNAFLELVVDIWCSRSKHIAELRFGHLIGKSDLNTHILNLISGYRLDTALWKFVVWGNCISELSLCNAFLELFVDIWFSRSNVLRNFGLDTCLGNLIWKHTF